MKVLHIETGRHLYGGPRQVLLLMDGLRSRGVEVALACPVESAIAGEAAEAGHRVITHSISGDLDLSAVTFLMRTVQGLKPDIVHAHSRRGADFFGGLAAALASTPAVLTRRVDNADTPVVGNLKYLAYDRIVAISDAVRAQLEHQGIAQNKLSTIRSSIDADACQPTWTRDQLLAEFNLPSSALVVAIVAQLIPRKGHALLLDAWPQVVARCPDARLLVLGEGPLEEDLRRHAGNGDTIRFAGFQPDLLDFLGRIDLLVHPATREGLGIAVLEAQAAGVPVVALAAGGVPEAVADGVTGLLIPADGTADTFAGGPASAGATAPLAAKLAEAMATLLTDAPRRRQMGAAAPAWIRDHFSADQMTEKYLTLYEDLIA